MLQKKQNPQNSDVEIKTTGKNGMDVDTLLIKELGQMGCYQLRTVLLLSISVIFLSWSSSEYIFTAARIPTRCYIPECESGDTNAVFTPEWISNAIPKADNEFDNCQRFANGSTFLNSTNECPADIFDRENVLACESFVYQNTYTVVYDFNLACDEWRRSLIGSVRTVGVLIAMVGLGTISDRFGRRTCLAVTAINTAWIGLTRYFANTYVGFMINQFAESAFGGGGFSCAYILAMETTGPKYRVVAGALMNSMFAIGTALLGLIAWNIPDWRKLTLALYIPQLLAISYFWIIPESARWYLSKGRYEDAEKSFKHIARVNKKQLKEESLIALRDNSEKSKTRLLADQKANDETWLIVLVFQYKPLLIRCLVTPIWWMTLTFIYYGLTINSVNISGNSYVNFIAVSLVEVPGFWAGVFFMNTVGRKPTLIAAYWICSACQFAYLFKPSDLYSLSLAVYLIGKCSIAMGVSTLYVYTGELYPTQYRHRLFGFSSMIGRIGAIIAPLTPAFGVQLPFILFGSFGVLAGGLALITPETRNTRLPETMSDIDNVTKSHGVE